MVGRYEQHQILYVTIFLIYKMRNYKIETSKSDI